MFNEKIFMVALKTQIQTVKENLNKPIAMIGMMGAGKSFLGNAVAGMLKLDFQDSDAVIEERAGISASEIFEHYGEEKFREFEFKVIDELCKEKPLVLSTGGGAPTHEATFTALLDRCVVVWLDADLDLMWSRVEQSKTRPLLQTEDPKGTLANLLQTRKPLYGKAHLIVPITSKNAGNAEKRIIKSLYEHLNKDSV